MKTNFVVAVALTLIALAVPRAVRADAVTFTVSGTFSDGTLLTGTVTINTTTGVATSANLSTTALAAPGPFVLSGQLVQASFYDINASDGLGNEIQLFFPTASLIGYTGGPLCAGFGANECFTPAPSFHIFDSQLFISGKLSPVLESGSLTTPEPPSLLLLGLGLVGFGIYLRKGLAYSN